jgi:hypothetical protein
MTSFSMDTALSNRLFAVLSRATAVIVARV